MNIQPRVEKDMVYSRFIPRAPQTGTPASIAFDDTQTERVKEESTFQK